MSRADLGARILRWYAAGHRALPWRQTRDPYRIWISEIMLQQTRAETVVGYYERFLARFPDVRALAAAPEADLLKAWEGLGYYSRARNLQRAAQRVCERHQGRLPADLEALRALPGIGAYTAGAIASIAFSIPAAAVDGNFERVLCRHEGIDTPRGTGSARREMDRLANALVPEADPGGFANGMMELGATLCTPKNPDCARCPIAEDCVARAEGQPERYPVKAAKKPKRIEQKAILLVFTPQGVLIARREARLLGGLYGFPESAPQGGEALERALAEMGIVARYRGRLGQARHIFTHIIWEMEIHAFSGELPEGGAWEAANGQRLAHVPMPTALRVARRLAAETMA